MWTTSPSNVRPQPCGLLMPWSALLNGCAPCQRSAHHAGTGTVAVRTGLSGKSRRRKTTTRLALRQASTEEEGMQARQWLWVCMLSMCLGGVMAQAQESPTEAAAAAAHGWLGHVDAGKYADSWRAASTLLQGAVTEEQWVASLNGVRKPLGKLVSRQRTSVHPS